MRRRGRGALWLVAAGSLLLAGVASGHGRSVSYSTWELGESGASVRARVSRLDLTRLGLDPTASRVDSDRVGRLLSSQLVLEGASGACAPVKQPTPLRGSTGWVVYSWTISCAGSGPRAVRSRLLLDVAPSHLHFARIVQDGRTVERVLSEGETEWVLQAPQQASAAAIGGTSFSDYLALGVEHILSGWDHLAFVIALLLLASTVGEVALLVTSFTAAHSVTLGLAVLGLVQPEAQIVEALIGFSIALVAAENSWLLSGRRRAIPAVVTVALAVLVFTGAGAVPVHAVVGLALFAMCHFALLRVSSRPARLRAAVACAFGLIHGFGFAGVLAEMALPPERLVAALVGFNFGVEAGQFAVVAVVWPLLRAVSRRHGEDAGRWLAEATSAGVCGLGIFWFVTRAFA
ncbi:MAG: HupE/UreJ family protein [Myxococcota bacterium]